MNTVRLVVRLAGIVLCYLAAITVALIIGYAFYSYPSRSIQLAQDSRTLIGTLASAFLIGPIWIGYNRLSVFDKLGDLTPQQRSAAVAFATQARAMLIKPTVRMAIFIGTMLVLLTVGTRLPFANIVLGVLAPLFFLYLLRRLTQAVSLLIRIETAIQDLNERMQKEAARKKAVEALIKARTESPLDGDEHLEKYRRVV